MDAEICSLSFAELAENLSLKLAKGDLERAEEEAFLLYRNLRCLNRSS